MASPRLLLVLGVALLAVVGVAYVLGYRGSSQRPTETHAATTSSPPVGFAFATAGPVRVSSYSSAIAWTTSEPSTGRLRWGPVGVEPVLWDTVEALGTRHVVSLSGLASSTTYHVAIAASSAEGHRARTELSFTTAPAPAQAHGGVRDGVLLVNGERFFPLLAWQQCPVQWQASLTAGIDVFAIGSPCAGPSSALTALEGRALVAGIDGGPSASGPGLLGWFYPDEADARGLTGSSLPTLPAGIRFLTLTAHFASAAAPLPAGRGMYPGLVAAADVVGFDLYPLQELCRRDLLPLDFDAQQQLEALAPGKPTFQWIEARGMRCGSSPGVSISPGTIRAESWLALAAGAHGLAFFPPDWDQGAVPAIRGIATRIHQLEPALLEPVQPVQVEAAPGVRAAARTYHDAVYVIAVNAGTKATDVRLTVPGLGNRTLLVLGGPKTLNARGDVFTDRLAPLGVRIYVAGPRTDPSAPSDGGSAKPTTAPGFERVSAATATTRRLVLGLAALMYAGVFAAFIFVEIPGLGIGNFFYIPVCLVAVVTDELLGALAGVLATGGYVVAVVLAPAVPSTQALTTATAIRLVTFTMVGTLMGFYASRNRKLVERLRDLAGRDFVTGLGNARMFDEELARRCAAGRPFALVLADADDLNELNHVHGHAAGNTALKRIGEVLSQLAEPGDVVTRIGGDDFGLLTRLPADQIAALQARTNRTLASQNLSATFGVTFCPDDGQTAAELFHKAGDRLFAAKLVRQNRATVVALANRSA